ncbi:mucin-19 [Anopheles bellator]|uniref:mucin-19 n=1 Tax=Anopheles bellator TaxID=139047 RepID=UPI0026483127|nr:mucin-19 [Anopheles bellator]
MSTLTNSVSNNNNNNNNNNHLQHHHSSVISSNNNIQQQQHLSSPQGTTPAAASSSHQAFLNSAPSASSINNNNTTSSDSNIINNNHNSSSSSHPTATPAAPSSGGVVGGILGVREVSAKLFLPFARTMMSSSSSSSHAAAAAANATDTAAGPMDTTAGGVGSTVAMAGNGGTGGTSSSSGRHQHQLVVPEALNVVLHGYQRKLKTNKKKYFVVYGDTPEKFARLEYFDSEKKFKQSFAKGVGAGGEGGGGGGPAAKRSIVLRSCFNINKRHDTKKHIIALFTKDDCFCIVFESEDELNRWLRTLLRLQRGEESEGDPPRPTFEHVWDVFVQRKGLGDSYGILGNYRLCITDKVLSLVRIGPSVTATGDQRVEVVEFSLASIRRCGNSQRYFYLEVGRSSKTGAGEIWMEVQDSIIAQNMHTTIMKSAKNKDDNLGPMIRIRSSSANAASKPTSMLFRRQTHTGQKPINCSPSSEEQSTQNENSDAQNSESSSSAASITTVVLVGPPSGATPRTMKPPNLDPNSEKPLGITSTATFSCSSTTTATTTSTTTSSTSATTTTATTTVTTTCNTATAIASTMVSQYVAPFAASSTSSLASPPSCYSPVVVVAGRQTSTGGGGALHSSSSSVASLGSGSPSSFSDAYIPLIPGTSSPMLGSAAAAGGGASVSLSGRGGLSGSPRLGVTAHSPSGPSTYRRASFAKLPPEAGGGGGALSAQQRHYHHHHPPHHALGSYALPPTAGHFHPHHHGHQHHPGLGAQLPSAVAAAGPPAGTSTGHHHHPHTGFSSTSSSTIVAAAVTTEASSSPSTSSSSSSSTDHVTTSASISAGVFHQRALSLPSAPMLGHSPHSVANHLSAIHASSSARSSSQNSVSAGCGGAAGGGVVVVGGSPQGLTGGVGGGRMGTIQPVHHRTRSLPLTEESAIRVTSMTSGHHLQHLQYYTQGASNTTSHRRSSSYLLSPANLHVVPANGGCSPPPLLSTSLHYQCQEAPPMSNGGGPGTESPSFASLVPSRSSMESIIEDQRGYLPMDLKKPPQVTTESNDGGGHHQMQLISRLLRSSNLQFATAPSSSSPGQQQKLKMTLQATASSGSPSSSSSSFSSPTHHHHHQHGNGGSSSGGTGNGTNNHNSSNSGGAPGSCSSPSQCSSSSNCNHASSHKSTNERSSPAALRRLNGGGRTAGTSSSTISRSIAIARERCDSLPSRNRTTSETMPHQQQLQHQLQQQQQQQQQQQYHQQLILNSGGMPPPRMIPSNRPHSMHISSSCHSHSPPVNSSPLSPPPQPGGGGGGSGAYSTGSDGSSLSIDESTDSFITGSLTPDEGNGFSKVINQLNSGGSIPEENSEEFIKDYSHIDLRTGAGLPHHLHHHGHHHHNSLSLPIPQGMMGRRGGSPAPPSTVGSMEGGSSAYMEMCSPSGSSPGDPSGSCYMAMSPVADYSRGLCSSSSAHSRASSLAEDLVDGYVPMSMPRGASSAVPTVLQPSEEYLSMDLTLNGGVSGPNTLTNRLTGTVGGGMSSAASSCSITSGTPSTDLRLSLEKVPAYIGQSGPDDCDMMLNDRPHRTYSVGSRPEHNKRKLRLDILSTGDGGGNGGNGGGSANSRVRAFSVGSRAKVPRSDGGRIGGYGAGTAIIVPFLSANESNNNSNSSISNAGSSYASGGGSGMMMHLDETLGLLGKKSSSGSLLPDGGTGVKLTAHGSFDRMGDLMEIDYSLPSRATPNGATGSSSTPLKKVSQSEPGMEDYLDMSGGSNNNNNNGEAEEDARRAAIVASHAVAGYVEMRPGRLNSQSSTSAAPVEEGDYLNMTPGGGHDVPDCPTATILSPKTTSSPIQILNSPKKFATPAPGPSQQAATAGSSGGARNNNYLEMYPRLTGTPQPAATTRSTRQVATKVPSEDYLNMSPLMMSGTDSGSEEKMMHPDTEDDVADPLVESSSAPDGYMEMSWPRNLNAVSGAAGDVSMKPPAGDDDYMNMSCGGGGGGGSEDRLSSAPITIHPTPGKCRLDLSEESKDDGADGGVSNIPTYLPLMGQNPDSARKNTVCLQQHQHQQHQQQQSGTIQTTTGQQSGWVGFSPSKANSALARARCDSRDSGIVTPSGSQATIFPFSPGSPTKPFPGAGAGDTKKEPLEDLSQNYAELSLGRQQQQQQQQQQHQQHSAVRVEPDYVNYCPAVPRSSNPTTPTDLAPSLRSRLSEDDGAGDYALMNPASSRKLSTTSMGAAGSGGATGAGCSTSSSSGGTSATMDANAPPVLVAKKSTLLSSHPAAAMGFKPIASSQDTELLRSTTTVVTAGAHSARPSYARQLSEWRVISAEPTTAAGVEPVLVGDRSPRPNSVNSELIGARDRTAAPGTTAPGMSSSGGGAMRPSSANSERLPSISAATTATSSSASSTSTLCESKNQSPSASCTALAGLGLAPGTGSSSGGGPRPDSVSSITDPHIISRPPSVSSERELHYASLDLPPCTKLPSSAGGTSATAPIPTTPGGAGAVQKMDVDEPPVGLMSNDSHSSIDSMNSSPSPSAGCSAGLSSSSQQQQQQQQLVRCSAFTYAQIDFVRSVAQAQKQHQQQHGSGPSSATATGSTPQSSQA